MVLTARAMVVPVIGTNPDTGGPNSVYYAAVSFVHGADLEVLLSWGMSGTGVVPRWNVRY